MTDRNDSLIWITIYLCLGILWVYSRFIANKARFDNVAMRTFYDDQQITTIKCIAAVIAVVLWPVGVVLKMIGYKHD